MQDTTTGDEQKIVDDAAKTAEPTSTGPQPAGEPPAPVVPAPIALPAEPAPEPIVQEEKSVPSPTPQPNLVVPPSPPPPSKKKSKAGIIAVMAALLLTLPVAVYYISQQNQQIADTRGRANPPPGPYPGLDCTNHAFCRNWCSSHGTEETEPGGECGGGYRVECNVGGQHYFMFCENGDDDDNDDNDTAPTNTPTPTTGSTPVCQNIKIYKGATQVTDLTTLRAGDDVVFAVKGNLSPTKAHFRVNGGSWTETATKNGSNEWTLNYHIPDGVADFVIEGEVFTNGAWH